MIRRVPQKRSNAIQTKTRQVGYKHTEASIEKIVDLYDTTKNVKVQVLLLMMILRLGTEIGKFQVVTYHMKELYPEESKIIIPLYINLHAENKFKEYLHGEVKGFWFKMYSESSDKIILKEAIQTLFPHSWQEDFKFIM